MADKKYYWLKLQEDFFNSKRIKKLRRLAGGDTFTIIYLKMQLLSLKNGGYIEFSGLEEDFSKEIALDIDEDDDNVKITIAYLLSCGLLETSDNVEYFLPYVAQCTGSETKWAEKKRKYRSKTNEVRTIEGQCPREIDIEIDIDKDIDILSCFTKEVVNYLNQKCGTSYRYKSTKTQGLIKARKNEGFTIDDFKKVIDIKYDDWHKDDKMRNYLRPETLFGTKFEGYLNQKGVKNGRTDGDTRTNEVVITDEQRRAIRNENNEDEYLSNLFG